MGTVSCMCTFNPLKAMSYDIPCHVHHDIHYCGSLCVHTGPQHLKYQSEEVRRRCIEAMG